MNSRTSAILSPVYRRPSRCNHSSISCTFSDISFPFSFCSGIVYRPVDKQLIIRLAGLQYRLYACDISVQSWQMRPEAIGRYKVYRRIEQPSRPGYFRWRKGITVIEYTGFTPARKACSTSGLHCDKDVLKCSVNQVKVSQEIRGCPATCPAEESKLQHHRIGVYVPDIGTVLRKPGIGK